MRSLLLYIILFTPFMSYAQAGQNNGGNNQGPGYNNPSIPPASYYGQAQGIITVPTFVDMSIIANNIRLRFDTWEEFINGKIYPSYLNVTVKANIPWLVKVKAEENFLSNGGAATSIPSSIVQLKGNINPNFIPLSTTEYPVLISTNNNIIDTKGIDVKYIAPWNATGGSYNVHLMFTLSAQ